ncbi:hypothetical protein GOBAR_DD26016 [Gossypium barbadense]|nr:hypothetical protein GOBAR_DD26016 [Gossypium barbadense]
MWRQWSLFIVGIGVIKLIRLSCLTELVDVKPVEDFTPLSKEYEVQDPCGSLNRGIVIHSDLRAHMWNIDLDATHVSEFPEYPDIVPAHRLAVESRCDEVFVGQKFTTSIPVFHGAPVTASSKSWLSFTKTTRMQTGGDKIYILQADNLDANNRVEKSNQMDARHVFVEDARKTMDTNCWRSRSMIVEIYSRQFETFRVTELIDRRPSIPPRFYGVNFLNKLCDCGRFQSLRYPCAHVIATCVHASINVEQYIE